jgi:deoxycytidine triphosphate deaminase
MEKTFGVFGQEDLRNLVKNGRIKPLATFDDSHIGPASIDLTVTDEVYRVKNLLQPSQLVSETVRSLIPKMGATKVPLGTTMMVGETYLAKGSIDVNFPPGMYGYFNAKSSSGRNFLFVRTLADGVHMFDSVDRREKGYTGEVWLVLQPLAFSIILTNKERYNQLRVFNADTRFRQADLDVLLQKEDLLFRRKNKEPYAQGDLSLFTQDGSVLCTLNAPAGKLVGYKTKNSGAPLDLTSRGVDPRDYFEPVYAESLTEDDTEMGCFRVEGGCHYLLSTNEIFRVPESYTAELVALDTRLGFFFTHFAGFFDPGWFGTATLEVYAPYTTILRHKQPIARFIFECMKSKTTSYAKTGTYQGQIKTQLPKQFSAKD